MDKDSGQQIWAIEGSPEDGQVAVNSEALAGPDLWIEEVVIRKLFVSNPFAEAINKVGLDEAFGLKECLVV